MKFLILALTFFGSLAQASDSIYGYAIRCEDVTGNLRISARQWDDDFAFQSRGLDESVKFVFMESQQKYSLGARTLIFTPAKPESVDLSLFVTKVRENSSGGFVGRGQVTLNHSSHALSCEIRYAVDEDEFDKLQLAQWADSILNPRN